ncbi:WhiB family transcriptional regulator [Streptomyces virginiae]|uniref:WhiB family transcriptional regulator n=1 Tax=Streptomyces virginiae TaxID=1961 RepID=UPI003650F26B
MKAPAHTPQAACAQVDTEDMFPDPSDRPGIEAALATCQRCPLEAECLEWALAPASRCNFGVFGGKTEQQRRALVRKRKLGKPTRPDYGPRPPANRRVPATA